jgi:hypothetical protein
LIFKGTVPTFADLPTDALNGWAYVAEDTNTIWVKQTDGWVSLGQLSIFLDNYYTKDETYSS